MQRQHFVPQFYLGGFTDTGNKRGKFWVYDRDAELCGRSSPKLVAHTTDFNLLTGGSDPMAFEKRLSAFESKTATVLQNIRGSGKIPPDEDFSYVLNLIAMLWCRNPRMRNSQLRMRERVARISLDLLASNRPLYESHTRSGKASGHIKPDNDLSYEEFSASKVDEYEIEFPPDATFDAELSTLDSTNQLFGSRYWSLLVAASNAPDFVCCDHPVSIWPKPSLSARFVGAATRYTECFFPLASRLALVGVFEDPYKEVFEVNAEGVARVNRATFHCAERYIYTKDKLISILYDGQVLQCPLVGTRSCGYTDTVC